VGLADYSNISGLETKTLSKVDHSSHYWFMGVNMKRNDLRYELWNFLYSQGFPSNINDEVLFLATEKVNFEAFKGKRLRSKNWSFIVGGEHAEDVALTILLAEFLGMEEGSDWDWGLDYDDHHFIVAFSYGKKVKSLLRLSELYYEASLVLIRTLLKVKSACLLEHHDLQQMFADEWERLREEKRRLKLEFLRKFVGVIL